MSGAVGGTTQRHLTPSQLQELAFNTQLGAGEIAQDGTEKRRIDLAGPSAQEVLTVERGRRSLGMQDHTVEHLKKEGPKMAIEMVSESEGLMGAALRKLGAASSAAQVLGGAMSFVGLVEFYGQMIEHTVSAKEEGEKLNDAMVRDAITVSVLLDASPLLPSGYLGARQQELRPAQRALDALRLNPKGAISPEQRSGLRVIVKERFKEGMITGLASGLKSPDELRQKMSGDAAFGEQYRADVAFREGVNAAVWLGQARPKEFEARRKFTSEASPPNASRSSAESGGPSPHAPASARAALSAPYKEGAEWGFGLDLSSRPKLDARLLEDASFKARYQQDSEFRKGVDFVVLVGEKRPEEFRRMQQLAERRTPAVLQP